MENGANIKPTMYQNVLLTVTVACLIGLLIQGASSNSQKTEVNGGQVQPEGEKAPAVMKVSIVGAEQPLPIKSEGNLPVEIKAQPKGEAPAVMKVHIEGIDAPLPVTLGGKKQQEWEYKVVTALPSESLSRTGGQFGLKNDEAMSYSTININQAELNQLGKQGWELLDAVMEVETAYPNFGHRDLHTGIKTNVRPQKVSLIFRRKVK